MEWDWRSDKTENMIKTYNRVLSKYRSENPNA